MTMTMTMTPFCNGTQCCWHQFWFRTNFAPPASKKQLTNQQMKIAEWRLWDNPTDSQCWECATDFIFVGENSFCIAKLWCTAKQQSKVDTLIQMRLVESVCRAMQLHWTLHLILGWHLPFPLIDVAGCCVCYVIGLEGFSSGNAWPFLLERTLTKHFFWSCEWTFKKIILKISSCFFWVDATAIISRDKNLIVCVWMKAVQRAKLFQMTMIFKSACSDFHLMLLLRESTHLLSFMADRKEFLSMPPCDKQNEKCMFLWFFHGLTVTNCQRCIVNCSFLLC